MYKAVDLAKHVVNKCVADNCPISNLQLQEILYFIQERFLKKNQITFAEDIEAWQFGPVVPDVYYKFCGYGAMPIASSFDVERISGSDCAMIDRIVEEKRSMDPWDLVADTHRENGAWDKVYQNGKGNRKTIPRDLIKKGDGLTP